jgi:predicted XRE-type DNA-binding protein
MSKKENTDAVRILRNRYVKGNKKRLAAIKKARQKLAIAQQIYDLRTKAGLSQAEFAELVGTKQSVISRLEDADYEGYSLSMLSRIAAACNQQLQVRFVPERSLRSYALR